MLFNLAGHQDSMIRSIAGQLAEKLERVQDENGIAHVERITGTDSFQPDVGRFVPAFRPVVFFTNTPTHFVAFNQPIKELFLSALQSDESRWIERNSTLIEMEDEKIYSSIANALEGFGKLRTAKVSIYSIEDKYARIPSLRFRFKELDKTDPVYTRIKSVVDSFKGNLRWTVVTHDETENYLITVLLDNIPHFLLSRAETEIYITNLGEDKYKEMIDKALDDIPNLASTLHRAASES